MKLRRLGTRAAALFAGLVAIVVLVYASGCVGSVFYQPDHQVYGTPKDAGLNHEVVEFASADGTRLSGWFIPAQGDAASRGPAKGTVLHLHGNAQNMTAHWDFVQWLPRRGYNLFVFDYRGYGASAGEPNAKGVYEDSNAALNYLRTRRDIDPQRILLLGQSLGGANAIAVLGGGNRDGVRAIVVESTFYSYAAIADDKVSGAGWLVDDTHSPERYIGKLAPVPFLLLHGTADQVIPYAHALRLMDKAGEPKQLLTIAGGRHLDAFWKYGSTYQDAVARFFDAALDSGKPAKGSN